MSTFFDKRELFTPKIFSPKQNESVMNKISTKFLKKIFKFYKKHILWILLFLYLHLVVEKNI